MTSIGDLRCVRREDGRGPSVGGLRVGEVIALGEVASQRAEMLRLLGRLAALCHHGQAQGASQADDRRDDGRVFRVPPQHAHERAVDLQHVHVEAPEVAQRGIPGAEVVDGQAHAETAEPVQDPEGDAGRVDEDALRDLQP